MSRPQDAASPNLPRPKDSSASLLAAFRSLTSSKTRQQVSSPSPATTAITSPESASSNPLDPPPLPPSVRQDTSDLPPSVEEFSYIRNIATSENPKAASLPGLRSILGDLHPERTIAQRISAAGAIISLLNDYAGADVVPIWDAARPLLDEHGSLQAVRAAYDLLDACVAHKNLAAVERRFLFESVARDGDIRAFNQRFKILARISDNGRNLTDLGLGFMAFLVRLLDTAYTSAVAARKARSAKAEEENLIKVFDFILDVLKYNSKTFTEIDLDLLISHIRPLSTTTTSVSDLHKSIEIMDVLTTYSCLPRMSLQPCVELLCGIFAGVSNLKDAAWQAVQHLLGSHLGPASISTLSAILKEAGVDSNTNVIRGACQLLTDVIRSDEVLGPQPTHLPKLVSAARQSLGIDSVRLEIDVMNLVLVLGEGPDVINNVFNEKAWNNIEAIIVHCARRLSSKSVGLPSDIKFLEPKSLSKNTSVNNLALGLQTLRALAERLSAIAGETHREQRRLVMRVLMQIVRLLGDDQTTLLIEYYSEESLLYTFNSNWHADFNDLLNAIFKDHKRSSVVRQAALSALSDAYGTGEALDTPGVNEMLLDVLRCLGQEQDRVIMEDLCSAAVDVATTTANLPLFFDIVGVLHNALDSTANAILAKPKTILAQPGSSLKFELERERETDLLSSTVTKSFVRMFLRSSNTSAVKSKKLYEVLLFIARSNDSSAGARVLSMRLLFRLRADTNNSIFVISNPECDDVAAFLCRTLETAHDFGKNHESLGVRPIRTEDQLARRPSQHQSSGHSTPRTTSRSNSTRAPNSHGRTIRNAAPLWLYPSLEGLPEEPPFLASHLLSSQLALPQASNNESGRTELKIGPWLELLLEILQQDELEWEVYSYVLVHLGAQLRNHALFVEAIPQIKMLRSIICGQLANRSFHEPPSHTNLKKTDAAICLYHILTMLISYRQHFQKSEEDDMVKMFVAGLGSWERTSETCIHALSMSCHELPGSLTRYLEGALSKMSQIITQSHLAVHILEFLAGLARLPELFKNFREDEFKVVFGICFRYLQDVRDSRAKAEDRGAVKQTNTQARLPGMSSSMVDDLPQYVYALTYHVMVFWFIASKMQDRHKNIQWIIRNLAYIAPDGQEVIEEQAQVMIDMMNRVAFSDRDDTRPHEGFSIARDGITASKTYLVGHSILTVETAGRSGASQITRRRPTGTVYSTYAPTFVNPPRHQVPINVGLAADAFYGNDYIGVLPEHVFQQLYSPSGVPATAVQLPEDEATRRAIASFDRISPLDGHKVGILYVGEGQDTESVVLSNVMGSADYTYFLRHIGTLCELHNAPFNTQGLDRSDTEMDGKFTFAWRDRVTELVFHVATMMPTVGHDPNCMYKKRHIGNDFVNIIFNNSGLSWKIENIPSDFNYINIIVTPEARASFVETRLRARKLGNDTEHVDKESGDPRGGADPFANLYYRVTVLTKSGLPAISPAHSTKIVSGASLPAFVRLLALNASVFCSVWANRESNSEHFSSWRSRLQEIKKLHDRYGSPEAAQEPIKFASAHHTVPSSAGSGTVESSEQARISMTSATSYPSSSNSAVNARESVVFRRQSKPNIFGTGNDSMSRISTLGSARSVDMERSSSASSTKT